MGNPSHTGIFVSSTKSANRESNSDVPSEDTKEAFSIQIRHVPFKAA
jgi:hypothetical protein